MLYTFFLALTILSICFAKVEIAIEGGAGWAENLPTWRLSKDYWFCKYFWGGRPLTGYHFWTFLFMILIFHFVFVFIQPTLALELKIISALMFFWIFEDFFWFVLNPAFGLKNFKKSKIWWHEKGWWLIAPRDYFVFTAIATTLLILASKF